MTDPSGGPDNAWRPLHPAVAAQAADARLQIHHAAQLATAIGISYLPTQADDSHTNLEWLADRRALASRPVAGETALRIAVRPHPFSLLAIVGDAPAASCPLDGRTIADAERWVRTVLDAHGIDGAAYTLARHYAIPEHPVADGAPFASDPRTFEELSCWFGDAALVLDAVRVRTPGAAEVRCWPHHFDIATLIALASGRSIGVGMEPGDTAYGEPYYYVNPYPSPDVGARFPALAGGGQWHTTDWVGAVLPAASLKDAVQQDQQQQVSEFIASSIAACSSLLGSSIGS